MGCDELRVRWMYVKLREKRYELLKPILPPEGVMLNVAMQRGRWEDYGISMTINATSSKTPGNQMATFFKDFIVIVDAGANEREYFGSGNVEAVIPFASIKKYEVVTEKISDDFEKKYLLFTMKKDGQQFSFKLFEKRLFDENYNYPWDYTPRTNGRKIGFYTEVVDKCMAGAVDYGKKAVTILKIMASMKEGFNYAEFQKHLVDTEDHHWSYALKFLRQMKEKGNKDYGAIYDKFKEEQQRSYNVGIENNKKIKEIVQKIEEVQKEIRLLEEEIPTLGIFAKSLKGEKLNRLEELDSIEPGLIRQQDALRAEIEKSHDEIEEIKRHTLESLYLKIVSREDYAQRMVEAFLMQGGQLTFDEIEIMLDCFNWLEPEHTHEEVRKFIVPFIEKDIIIIEDDKCYYKDFLDTDRLKKIENKRNEGSEGIFVQHKTEICDFLREEVTKRRVIRKQVFVELLNERMMTDIGFISEYFNQQIIDELIESGTMKDINSVYVSLK